ncbi:hypothetical protein [Citrobacter freundii]|uniref:hypothetical protein n=1 Tax=Citrobacter freundii TaxID=546 RepID=UPI003A978352
MKKNDCLCRRYTAKEWGNDETTIEVFIGYKLLREPSSSEPGQFTMVELRRTVTDGKAENWSETKLEGPFEATAVSGLFQKNIVIDDAAALQRTLFKLMERSLTAFAA